MKRTPIIKPTIIIKFLLVILTIAMIASEALSATFVVTKIADTNDGVCDSDCSLREAIAIANSAPTNDEIRFDPIVFSTSRTITLGGTSLIINNNGGLTISGPGPNLLTISGNNLNRVIIVNNYATAVISGVTISDGNGHNIGAGGGIANLGSLELNNSIIRNNFGEPFGGGIYNQAVLSVTDTRIINNNGDLYGGGIYNFNDRAILTVNNSTVSDNTARRDGGGIYNNGTASITGSTISGNIATSQNDGGNGGGIFTTGYVNRNSSVTVINSTIANNVSLAGGGGIMNDGSVVNLTNVTINGNSVTSPLVYYYGGGVVNYQENYPGTVRARNTIIADNTSANGQAPDFGGVMTSQGFNLIENTHWTYFTEPPQNNIFGQDPRLSPLANNGGLTQTCALLPGSPAIDAITNNSPVTDQRFYARSAISDIGAFESNSIPAALTGQISGRITIGNARGASPARVLMVDNEGNSRITAVNPFGYYRFREVTAGKTYTLKVGHKLYSFIPRVIFVTGDVNNVDFSVTS